MRGFELQFMLILFSFLPKKGRVSSSGHNITPLSSPWAEPIDRRTETTNLAVRCEEFLEVSIV